MAKVTAPLNSGEARGKVGDLVYNTWRGIATVRARVTPKNEFTEARVAMQDLLKTIAPTWKNLDHTTRALWHAFAAQHVFPDWTGLDLKLPAWNWFIRTQMIRAHDALTPSDLPPEPACLLRLWPTYAYPGAGEADVQFNSDPHETSYDFNYEAWLTHPLSTGRNPTLHDAHFIKSGNAYPSVLTIPLETLGTYTIFMRPVHNSGIPGTWSKMSFYWDGT